MGKRRGITYIRIPAYLLRLKVRSAHELAALGLAVGFSGSGLRMSNSELARLLQMDRRHVPRLVGRLVDRGYLRVEDEDGRRVIYPTDTILVPPPDAKMVTPRHQNGDKVTPDVPPPSITEVTEIELKGAQSVSRSRSPKAKAKPFSPPTVEDVRQYAAEKGRPDFDAEYFVEHYTLAAWHDKGGKPITIWKQTLLGWLRRDEKRRAGGNGDGKRQAEDDDDTPTEEELIAKARAGGSALPWLTEEPAHAG